MREFLEDAAAHREDGVGRAGAAPRRELPKRFYKAAEVVALDGGFAVGLDGRVPKTPGLKPVVVPSEAVAARMAVEWAAQGDIIDPATMPLVRIVNSAVEAGEGRCRRCAPRSSTMPATIFCSIGPMARRRWYAGRRRCGRRAGAAGAAFRRQLPADHRVLHQAQPAPTLTKLAAALEGETLLPLTAMNVVVSITGSGLLALALRHGLVEAEGVWRAAHVDEDHNIQLWGEVEEITARRAQRRREFDAATELLVLSS